MENFRYSEHSEATFPPQKGIYGFPSLGVLRNEVYTQVHAYPNNPNFQNILEQIDSCQSHINEELYLIKYSTQKALQSLRDEYTQYEKQTFLEFLRTEVQKDVYTQLHISENITENHWTQNFLKGCFDTWILDNIELVHILYETKGAILWEIVKTLTSREGLREVVQQI